MPPNSISLEFNKMPAVTVDGKTHKFKADKAGGYDQINVSGVTYSLVKDKDSGRYTMNITGEPAALEKYNFTVGKGRVTEGKFGGDSMEDFFTRPAHVGEGIGEKHYADFSFAGGHLKDKVSFLQSGAWGLDPMKAHEKLQKLNEEAEAAAKKSTNPKTEAKPGNEPPVEVYQYVPPWERNSPQPGNPPTNESQLPSQPPDAKTFNYDPTAAIARAKAAEAAEAAEAARGAGVQVVSSEGGSEGIKNEN